MSANPSAANAKILVIDDDKDLRYSLRRALAKPVLPSPSATSPTSSSWTTAWAA